MNRDALKNFLNENGCETTEKVMAVREPYCQIAKNGVYNLAPEKEINTDQVKQAISAATKKTVQKIVFVSMSNPFSRPEWMTEESYKNSPRDSFWTSLKNSLGDSPGDSLKDSLGDSPKDSLDVGRRIDLGDILNDDFGTSLWDIFKKSLGDSFWTSLGDSFWTSFGDILVYFVSFSLANKNELSSRIEPLLQLLVKCFILGEKKDEPGTWLVLVA